MIIILQKLKWLLLCFQALIKMLIITSRAVYGSDSCYLQDLQLHVEYAPLDVCVWIHTHTLAKFSKSQVMENTYKTFCNCISDLIKFVPLSPIITIKASFFSGSSQKGHCYAGRLHFNGAWWTCFYNGIALIGLFILLFYYYKPCRINSNKCK